MTKAYFIWLAAWQQMRSKTEGYWRPGQWRHWRHRNLHRAADVANGHRLSNRASGHHHASLLKCALMAMPAVIATAVFVLEHHWGFSLSDESYLWYGAQHLRQGEVPLRDFMSYDLGRYLLASAGMWLQGSESILALRNVLGLVGISATVLGCYAVARAWRITSVWQSIPMVMLCVLWMAPRFKVFDVAASVVLVVALAGLLKAPNRCRLFGMGVAVGLLGVLGRNHGVYALLAVVLAIAWLIRYRLLPAPRWQALLWLTLGILVGYAPVWIPMLFIPGFASAMWQSVVLMFDFGSTNLSLPIPWPWKVLLHHPGDIDGLITGIFLLSLLAFDAVGLWLIYCRPFARQLSPLFLAAVCASVPYTHYALSRANISHLSHAIMPMLLGVLAGHAPTHLATWRRTVLLPVMLLALSMPVALLLHPGYCAWAYGPWQQARIGDETLMIAPAEARLLNQMHALQVSARSPGPFYIAPLFPGAYVLDAQRSPTWEIYPITPRPDSFQRAEIARLRAANIGLAAILDAPVDGDEGLRFSHSHALIYRYLQDCFIQRPRGMSDSWIVFDGPDRCR